MTASFLIVRLGSLGDLIHTLPAVAALRRAHPDARIDWLVEAPHRGLLDLVPIVSSVIVLKGRSLGGWLATSRELRARRYDVALEFQGLVKSAALARFSGAREVVGFDRAALREPMARWFYTRVAEVGEGRHVIDKNLALVAQVAQVAQVGQVGQVGLVALVAQVAQVVQGPLEFPIRAVDSPAVAALRRQGHTKFALVNPGAAWPNKRWPAERFGAIAKIVRDEHGLTPVVLWGPGERALAESVAAASTGAAIVAPETQLPDLVALSRASSFMISGDTGPLHIAAATGTPIVSLFGPTDPARNGPWAPSDRIVSRYGTCACHYRRRCRAREWCLGGVEAAEVTRAIEARLT